MDAMRIIYDLLSIIDYKAPVREVCQGPFQTAALTHYCGLASTPHEVGPHYFRKPVQEAGSLTEKTARDFAGLHVAKVCADMRGIAAVGNYHESMYNKDRRQKCLTD